jgi:hypothetical protein
VAPPEPSPSPRLGEARRSEEPRDSGGAQERWDEIGRDRRR